MMINSHLKYTIQRRKSRTGKEEDFPNDEDEASISLSIATSSLSLFHTIEDFSEERNQIWANFQRLPSEKEFILEALVMIKGRNEPVYQYNWEDMSHLKVSILYDKVLPTAFRDNKRTHANIAWWNGGIKDSRMRRVPRIFGAHNYENLDMVNHMLHYYQVTSHFYI